MTEEALAARREYKRKWAQQNRDKTRAAEARYWEKKAKEFAEAAAADEVRADCQ